MTAPVVMRAVGPKIVSKAYLMKNDAANNTKPTATQPKTRLPMNFSQSMANGAGSGGLGNRGLRGGTGVDGSVFGGVIADFSEFGSGGGLTVAGS